LTGAARPGTRTRVNQAAADTVPGPQAKQDSPDGARRAGRGVLSIAGAKLYFLLTGYAAQLLLPRLLITPEAFGLFSTALSLVSILNNVMVSATIQVVSKRVSEDREHTPHTLRHALVLQATLGALIAGLLFVCAPYIAASLLDPLLTPLFRLSAVIVFAYALYSAPIGAINGRQDFVAQARFDMGYTTLRTGAMLGAAALGFGAVGVFAGFALASFLVLLAALAVVGFGKPGKSLPWKSWLSFMAPLWLYQLCLNLIMQIDVTLLKRNVAELLQAQGQQLVEAADVASRYVGFYRAAETFAFVPYQLILAVAFVIFPMVSQALSLGDEVAARRYVASALRFSLLLLLALAAPIAGAARGVLRLVYPAAYATGAPALAVLAIAMVCFAMFVIGATIMTGAGRPGLSATLAVLSGVTVVAGNWVFVRLVGVGEYTLVAAALGTGLGMLVAVLAMGTAVYKRFGAFIAPSTALRTAAASLAGFAVSRALVSDNRLMSLVALALGALSYLTVLWLLRELTAADLAPLARLTKRAR
jgi:stage V sporulation protein B